MWPLKHQPCGDWQGNLASLFSVGCLEELCPFPGCNPVPTAGGPAEIQSMRSSPREPSPQPHPQEHSKGQNMP